MDANNSKEITFTDGTYKVIYSFETKKYTAYWETEDGEQSSEITEALANLIDEFRRKSKSIQHEYERHSEHREQTEIDIYIKALYKPILLEDEVIIKDSLKKVMDVIDTLTEKQKQRARMYFFAELTLEEIARIEGCTAQAIKKSIDQTREKVKKFLK